MKKTLKHTLIVAIIIINVFGLVACQTSAPVDYLADYQVIDNLSVRMPAEYEECSMIMMCYPNMMTIDAYKTIAEDNKILLLVNYGLDEDDNLVSRIDEAKQIFVEAGVNMENVTFLDMDIDWDYTYWARDFSPFYVFNDYELSIVDFTYNRPQRVGQNVVPEQLAEYFDIPYYMMDIVHTGGNLMQDGRGTAFSDDLVITENDRDWDKVLGAMEEYTGTENYVITIDPQGDYIAHIDCWAKIVAPDKIIVASLPKTDERYLYYETVAFILGNTQCAYGYNYRIYRVEEPGGDIVAPYTNSLIANNRVYMPLGEDEEYNKKALAVYQEALPGYEIIGIKCPDFVYDEYYDEWYNGFLNTDALHCRTHEIPCKDMLFIDSRNVYHGIVPKLEAYVVKTNIVSYSQSEVNEEDVVIYYSINNGDYQKCNMSRYKDTTNFTYVFTNLKSGDDVRYYIEAKDSSGHNAMDPYCGVNDPHHFMVE